ncbi:outer membrane trimeric porin-like protein DcaP [Acinetobacter sp. 1000160]|uniref:outer membrane trimeric porin-like protein DcaP n=1 Tax=Acinetobacter sp. 1000160 TaxID=1310800 RepID=UPI0004478593|nr:outer membrane trimeric porin-like protein DcaP [Acinetobacter sp. 1000160]EXB48785.1 outer membrane beta-barrel domain protein [Acinetobacter baumannii 146457]EYT22517.1 outer membrane beta-barrel domain protein [Acinetobacter sp. 1000160]
MKKLILATACAVASGTIFANTATTTEQRINLLETELQKLKAELQTQKQTQNNLQVKQAKIEENVEKNITAETAKPIAPSWVTWTDNVKVYGIARLDAAVDFKSSPDSGGRTTSSIYRTPFENDKRANHSRSDASINASRLGVYFNSPDKAVTGNVEADFFDSSNMGTGDGKFRIRHAYFTYKDWTFGQTWSLMSNMETRTESVDYTQFMGTSYTRTPQVRYDWKIDQNHDLKVALEHTGSRVSAFPSLTGRYTFKQGPLTALAQGFVNEKSVDVAKDTVKKVSWGAGTGLKYQFDPQQSVQANYQYIVGDQKFMPYTTQSGLANATALNAAGDFSLNQDKTDLLMNKLHSFNIGYSYKFNDQWRSNLSASLFEYDYNTEYAKLNQDANKRLTDYAANIFYSPAEQIDIGLEYHQGKREVFDGRTADVSRLNFVSMYKF